MTTIFIIIGIIPLTTRTIKVISHNNDYNYSKINIEWSWWRLGGNDDGGGGDDYYYGGDDDYGGDNDFDDGDDNEDYDDNVLW